MVGQGSDNPELNEWHTQQLVRLPGLKFMRTLWVCEISGGGFQFSATKPGATELGLEEPSRGAEQARTRGAESRPGPGPR